MENKMDIISKQRDFETKYHYSNLVKVIKEQINACSDFVSLIDSTSNPKVAEKLAVDLVINKRFLVQVAVSKYIYHFNENAQLTANFIVECINKGVCGYDIESEKLIPNFMPENNILERIHFMMHPLPMLTKPCKLESNFDSAYMFSPKESQVYNSNTEEDVCLDVLNAMSSIPLVINQEVANNGHNCWRSVDQSEIESLDDLTPQTPTQKQFRIFDSHMKTVLKSWVQDNVFYLPWKYDRRGRFYDDGYLIKVQGNDYQKAIIDMDIADFVKIDEDYEI